MVGSSRIFTLPAGYRPSEILTLVGLGCGTGAVFVSTNGDLSAGFSSGVCTLDEITFRAD
jgi:hypothetical protein